MLHAKLSAALIAPEYDRPSSDECGTHASSLSASLTPYLSMALSDTRRKSLHTWCPNPREPQCASTVTCPSLMPMREAASSSCTLSTRCTSRKWLPDPRLPSCGMPLLRAFSDTFDGSAPAMRPPSSHESASAARPYPLSTAHRTPLVITSSSCEPLSDTAPFEPTPDGIELNRSATSSLSLGLASASDRFVRSRRTPQLMSYPTPPGLIMPSSASMAATPPTGNPYPSWPSGSTTTWPTTPGIDATLVACHTVRSDAIFPASCSSANMRTGTLMPLPAVGSTTYSQGPLLSGTILGMSRPGTMRAPCGRRI